MERETLQLQLRALAANYRWAWDTQTQSFFCDVDAEGFRLARRNPWAWLQAVGEEKAVESVVQGGLSTRLQDCYRSLIEEQQAPAHTAPPVAYFCMEYGIHESLPMYSGGLGILAGDHLKAASDLRLDLVAVGLLYTEGYLAQGVDAQGQQVSGPAVFRREDHPMRRLEHTVQVQTPAGTLHADVYELEVGRTRLFLLDPDVERNEVLELRGLCRRLYGGDHVTRIRQELLVGVGGLRLLQELGLADRVLHMNEGHCAFALAADVWTGWKKERTLASAATFTRRRTVFTTHTPVPAGHDRFDAATSWHHLHAAFEGEEAFLQWLLTQSFEEGTEPGSICMTVLALNLSERCNGVSKLHGEVSREMWSGYSIGHITNGIHVPSWVAPEIRSCPAPSALPAVRDQLRSRLVAFVRDRLNQMSADCRTGTPERLRDDILTIGFARRFATYKRATLLFRDEERFVRLLTNEARPVQILYAGKAHPADQGGQALMRLLIQAARNPRFGGRIHFLPDYDMEMGRYLVQGCDVWLNTPRRPMEASGTSGQKAAMNGCLNLSIADGWWPEGYDGHNGWSVVPDSAIGEQSQQDLSDAEAILTLLEKQITPAFYAHAQPGHGADWSAAVAHSVGTIAAGFSARRMLSDYMDSYYGPAGRAGGLA